MKKLQLESKQIKLLILLFAGVLMGALDIAIIGPALPAIKDNLGISLKDSSWIFNIYLLCNLVAVPIFAKISDTYGRRDIYILSILLFAIGSLVIVLSDSFQVLLIGRAIQGIGAGGIFPVASAVIGDTFPLEKQGSALGMIGAVFGVAFIIGPIIGGIILLWDWHYIFAINLPIAAIIIYFALKLIPKTKARVAKKFDFIGLITLSIILIFTSLSFNSLKSEGLFESISNPSVYIPLIISIILIPIFIKIEKKSDNPIISPKLFSKKPLIVTYLIGVGAGFAESSAMFMPLFAQENFKLSHSNASFMLIPMVFAMLIGAPISGRLLDTKGPRFSVMLGISILFGGFLSFILYGFNIFGFYFAGILVGIGLAFLLGAPLRYMVNTNSDETYRASGQGVVTLTTSTGKILSTALLGAILNNAIFKFSNYQAGFSFLLVITILMLVAAYFLPERKSNNSKS